MNCRPPAGHEIEDCHQPHHGPADIDHGLNHVGPDDRGQATFECVDQRQCRDDRNRSYLAGPQRNGNDNRHRIHAHALGCSTREQE